MWYQAYEGNRLIAAYRTSKLETAKKYLKKSFPFARNITWKKASGPHEGDKLGNPSETLRSGEWTPAHAVRIRKGKLEILR